jgi:hypothetical protein
MPGDGASDVKHAEAQMKIKFCIECKWAEEAIDDDLICTREGVGTTSLVHGEMEYPTCEDEREKVSSFEDFLEWRCGPRARHFQPKETSGT